MSEQAAVWLIIVLGLIAANLPFVTQRPLLVLPWVSHGGQPQSSPLRWLESLVFFALVYGLCLLAYRFIGTALVMGSDWPSRLAFQARILAYLFLFALLLYWPGWRVRRQETGRKSFGQRLLELAVLYAGVGVLAFALEFNLGSRFPQTWEFYAITVSLFLVMAYPGYVLRYLLKRSRSPRRRSVA